MAGNAIYSELFSSKQRTFLIMYRWVCTASTSLLCRNSRIAPSCHTKWLSLVWCPSKSCHGRFCPPKASCHFHMSSTLTQPLPFLWSPLPYFFLLSLFIREPQAFSGWERIWQHPDLRQLCHVRQMERNVSQKSDDNTVAQMCFHLLICLSRYVPDAVQR